MCLGDVNRATFFHYRSPLRNDPHLVEGINRQIGRSIGRQFRRAKERRLRPKGTRNFGDFQVIEDDKPPRELEFTPNGAAPISSARPHIHATVADAGSGIAAWDLRCDGHWLLSAYDPEAGCIDWERDEDLAPGTHELTLKLTDSAGNSSTSRHSIIIPKK